MVGFVGFAGFEAKAGEDGRFEVCERGEARDDEGGEGAWGGGVWGDEGDVEDVGVDLYAEGGGGGSSARTVDDGAGDVDISAILCLEESVGSSRDELKVLPLAEVGAEDGKPHAVSLCLVQERSIGHGRDGGGGGGG